MRRLALIHPVPSALVAAVVASLALVAGGEPTVAGLLAVAMLGFQFSIGALNDVVDVEADRLTKPGKPMPAGLVSGRAAMVVVILGGSAGLVISAGFGTAVLILGALGYASGVAYDVSMRRRGLGWLCFAAAFPLLIAWTWVAVTDDLPPGWPFLLPMAALAGPTVHLANSLVDVDLDDMTGGASLATQLGLRRARPVLAGLVMLIYLLAWATLATAATLSGGVLGMALVATLAASLGVVLSWQEAPRAREAGWLLQAVGLASMAVAWLASMT